MPQGKESCSEGLWRGLKESGGGIALPRPAATAWLGLGNRCAAGTLGPGPGQRLHCSSDPHGEGLRLLAAWLAILRLWGWARHAHLPACRCRLAKGREPGRSHRWNSVHAALASTLQGLPCNPSLQKAQVQPQAALHDFKSTSKISNPPAVTCSVATTACHGLSDSSRTFERALQAVNGGLVKGHDPDRGEGHTGHNRSRRRRLDHDCCCAEVQAGKAGERVGRRQLRQLGGGGGLGEALRGGSCTLRMLGPPACCAAAPEPATGGGGAWRSPSHPHLLQLPSAGAQIGGVRIKRRPAQTLLRARRAQMGRMPPAALRLGSHTPPSGPACLSKLS